MKEHPFFPFDKEIYIFSYWKKASTTKPSTMFVVSGFNIKIYSNMLVNGIY